jgi:uncharacterized protein YjbI with pentapeptide repeats
VKIYNESGMIPGWLVGHVPPHRWSASLALRGTFEILPGQPARLLDQQPELAGDVPDPEAKGSIRYSMDLVPVKPFIDLLLVGRACVPGRPAPAVPVTFSVGRWSKTLYVVGDRVAKKSLVSAAMTDPAPFESLPLDWGRSYGGSDWTRNPAGRGRDERELPDGSRGRPLPNILRREELSAAIDALREPAGFGPLAPDWPQRMDKPRKASFDKKWLEENWPGYPRDFDWSYFNAAPEDQQLPLDAIQGDEPLSFTNLFPGQPLLSASLPGVRPRWFMRQEFDGGEAFVETRLNLDTVWVDTEAARLVLVWRGVAPIRSKKMSEVVDHLVVREPLAEPPQPAARYRELLEEAKKREAEEKAAAPTPISELPPLVIPEQTFDWDKWEKQLLEDKAKAEQLLKELSADDPETSPLAAAEGLFAKEKLNPEVLHPTAPQNPHLAAAQIAAAFAKASAASPALGAQLGPPPTAAQLDAEAMAKKIEKKIDDAFAAPLPAGPVPIPEAPPDQDLPWTRERVVQCVARGEPIRGQDLSGLDLSTLDLTGACLAGSLLADVRLTGAVLAGADLSEAVLAGADFSAADLRKANLARADLTGANLAEVRLEGAELDSSDASKAIFKKAMLAGVHAARALFTEGDFEGADLSGGEFTSADFTKANLTGVNLEKSKLDAAGLYGVRAAGLNLRGASMANARVGEDADLTKACLIGLTAPGSIWSESRLDGADFTDAILTAANFTEASLVGAVFVKADLRKARLPDANLERLIALKANLFRGTLEGSRIAGADFRGANLYEVEFLDTERKGTAFDLANLKGTKLG